MFEKKEQDKLSQYEDPIGGFSSRDLRLATWYVRHKDQLRAIFVICFALFDAALVGYGFWGWGAYLFFGYTADQRMLVQQVAGFQNYEAQHYRYSATPLQFASPEVYESGNDRYDLVIDVQNANANWVAFLTYRFSYAGGNTEEATVAIMPSTRMPIASIGIPMESAPRGIQFQPVSIAWKRINPHIVPDPAEYLARRNVFSAGDVAFFYASEEDTSGHRIVFDITNDSVFGYWQPQFLVELRDGQGRVGVIPLTIDGFPSGETTHVEYQSFRENLFVSDVVVHPRINFFDASEYME